MTKSDFLPLPLEFYNQDTVSLAQNLLGKILVFQSPNGLVAGKIVETESYLHNDPSSHSFNGINKRNQMMFRQYATVYIYQIYGMYHCLNIVTGPKGVGEAVLIRALEPFIGIEIMKENRNQKLNLKSKLKLLDKELINLEPISNLPPKQKDLPEIKIQKLCNGPAKLVLALGVNKDFNGHLIWQNPLWIAEDPGVKISASEIITATRIGISKAKDLPLRFYLKDNIFISKK